MTQPNVFIIKPEQVGSTDVPQFLLNAISKEFVDNTLKESILMSSHLGYSIQHPLPHVEHWFGLLINYLLSHKNSINSLKKSIILTQKVISSSTIRVDIDEIICGLAETNNIIGELLGKLKEKERE